MSAFGVALIYNLHLINSTPRINGLVQINEGDGVLRLWVVVQIEIFVSLFEIITTGHHPELCFSPTMNRISMILHQEYPTSAGGV